jgi:hypothetical protein
MVISYFEKLTIFFNATIELYIYPNDDYEHIVHNCIHLTNKFFSYIYIYIYIYIYFNVSNTFCYLVKHSYEVKPHALVM